MNKKIHPKLGCKWPHHSSENRKLMTLPRKNKNKNPVPAVTNPLMLSWQGATSASALYPRTRLPRPMHHHLPHSLERLLHGETTSIATRIDASIASSATPIPRDPCSLTSPLNLSLLKSTLCSAFGNAICVLWKLELATRMGLGGWRGR